jgi:hypothetical protein
MYFSGVIYHLCIYCGSFSTIIRNWNSLITSMQSIFLFKKKIKDFQFLYNSYVIEYEFFLLFIRKQSS